MTAPRTIVLLAGDGPSTGFVYNALVARYGDVRLIMEQRPSRRRMLWRRVRRLGPVAVVGQLLFMFLVAPLLARRGKGRIQAIERAHGLSRTIPADRITWVESVNSPEVADLLKSIQPEVVVVNGTRIIGQETLDSINVPFINMHAGITPLYRGVHGGYWALSEGRPELAGTTVHLVDSGIDTGDIIEQATFEITGDDSFATYPYLHTAVGIPVLLSAVKSAIEGSLATRARDDLPSRLRTHPTVWYYLYHRIMHGVR